MYFVPVPIDRREECSKEGKHDQKNKGYVQFFQMGVGIPDEIRHTLGLP